MNPDNRWVKMADRIPWDEFEIKYAALFPSGTTLIKKIQKKKEGTDHGYINTGLRIHFGTIK